LGGGCGSRTVDLNPGESLQFREATLFTSKENSKGFLGFFASKGACGVKRKVFLTFDFSPGGTSIHIFVCTKFPFFSPLRQWVQVWVTDFAI